MAVYTKVSDAKKQEILNAVGGYLEGTKNGKKVVTNDASLGGLAQGKKHTEGGIKGVNKSTQQYVEIQDGEPVINERSANMPATHNFNGKTLTNKQILNEINTAAGGAEIKAKGGEIGVAKPIVYTGGQVVITAKALDDKTLKEFDGKQMTNQEILSHINEQGGGLSFAQGGNMPSTLNCSGKMYNFGGEMQDDYSIAKSCGCKHQKALQDRADFNLTAPIFRKPLTERADFAENNRENQFAAKGLQIKNLPLKIAKNKINNIVDFRNALKKSQLKYSDNFSYKNGSHYLTIEGTSFRVADHTKPKGTTQLYEEGENDFRSYQELYNELEKRFDMSDKTDVEKMYKKNAQKDIVEDYSLGELSYKTPDNRLYENVENAVSSMWYRRYDYDKYTKNKFAAKGIQIETKNTNPFEPVNSAYYNKQNGMIAEEENFKSGGTIILGKHKFKGYNIPVTAPENDTHKKMVLVNDGENIKIVKFGLRGMQDFTQHKDEQRRKNYLTRSAGIVDGRERLTKDNPLSANYWSRRILWDSGEDILKPIYVDENVMLEDGATIEKKSLLAPNGKPSNLNETQWHLVRTTAFKNWFGDWENDPQNASKVVDENGEPLVVYHGTSKQFDVFNESKTRVTGNSGEPLGFYFSEYKNTAIGYAENSRMYHQDNKTIILKCFLSLKNPKIIYNLEDFYGLDSVDLRRGRFDGIIRENGFGIKVEIAAFNPNQIKLATGENTTFGLNSNNIYFADGGNVNVIPKEIFLLLFPKMWDNNFTPQERVNLMQGYGISHPQNYKQYAAKNFGQLPVEIQNELYAFFAYRGYGIANEMNDTEKQNILKKI